MNTNRFRPTNMSDVPAKKRKLAASMCTPLTKPPGTPCVVVHRARISANRNSMRIEAHKFATQREATAKFDAWRQQRGAAKWSYENNYFPHDVDIAIYVRDPSRFSITPTSE